MGSDHLMKARIADSFKISSINITLPSGICFMLSTCEFNVIVPDKYQEIFTGAAVGQNYGF
jgi:hypothetical protein